MTGLIKGFVALVALAGAFGCASVEDLPKAGKAEDERFANSEWGVERQCRNEPAQTRIGCEIAARAEVERRRNRGAAP